MQLTIFVFLFYCIIYIFFIIYLLISVTNIFLKILYMETYFWTNVYKTLFSRNYLSICHFFYIIRGFVK